MCTDQSLINHKELVESLVSMISLDWPCSMVQYLLWNGSVLEIMDETFFSAEEAFSDSTDCGTPMKDIKNDSINSKPPLSRHRSDEGYYQSITGLHIRYGTKKLLGKFERKMSAQSFFLTSQQKSVSDQDVSFMVSLKEPVKNSPIVEEVSSSIMKVKKQAKKRLNGTKRFKNNPKPSGGTNLRQVESLDNVCQNWTPGKHACEVNEENVTVNEYKSYPYGNYQYTGESTPDSSRSLSPYEDPSHTELREVKAVSSAVSLPQIHQLSDYEDSVTPAHQKPSPVPRNTESKRPKKKRTNLRRRPATREKDGRSKSLTQIDNLVDSSNDMLLIGSRGEDGHTDSGTDKLGLPDETPFRRPLLSNDNRVMSGEFITAVVECGKDSYEELIIASRGVSLREALENRALDPTVLEVYHEGSCQPINMHTDTSELIGKCIHLRGRDDSRHIVRSRSAQHPRKVPSASRFMWGGGSTEEYTGLVDERTNSNHGSQEGSMKVKTNKSNNRWSLFQPNNKHTMINPTHCSDDSTDSSSEFSIYPLFEVADTNDPCYTQNKVYSDSDDKQSTEEEVLEDNPPVVFTNEVGPNSKCRRKSRGICKMEDDVDGHKRKAIEGISTFVSHLFVVPKTTDERQSHSPSVSKSSSRLSSPHRVRNSRRARSRTTIAALISNFEAKKDVLDDNEQRHYVRTRRSGVNPSDIEAFRQKLQVGDVEAADTHADEIDEEENVAPNEKSFRLTHHRTSSCESPPLPKEPSMFRRCQSMENILEKDFKLKRSSSTTKIKDDKSSFVTFAPDTGVRPSNSFSVKDSTKNSKDRLGTLQEESVLYINDRGVLKSRKSRIPCRDRSREALPPRKVSGSLSDESSRPHHPEKQRRPSQNLGETKNIYKPPVIPPPPRDYGFTKLRGMFVSTSDSKMDDLVRQLDLYSKNGIPKLPHLLPCQAIDVEDEVKLTKHWRDIVAGSDQLSEREEHRNSALWELVETEATYINMLKVITDLFLACLCNLQNERILNEIDTEKLFNNIQDIYQANLRFWKDHFVVMLQHSSRTRQRLDPRLLAEGFYKFEEILKPYTQYCLEQTNCQQYCKINARENSHFRAYLAWCETQKECNRLKLVDILVHPMQRLTRYSILLKAILKKTDEEEQRICIKSMIGHVDRFVSTVNSALRNCHEQERLRHIISKIESYEAVESCKDDELTAAVKQHCELNLLQKMPGCPEHIPRWLIHQGDFKLRDAHTSKMEVHVFIFTDFLLITKVTQRKAEKVKVVRPPYRIDKLLTVELKDALTIGLIHVNEWGVATAAFTLQSTDSKSTKAMQYAISTAKKQYHEAKMCRNQPPCPSYDADDEVSSHLPPRSPRLSSSPRGSRVSSLGHSHSGSMDLNEGSYMSPGGHHPPSVDLSEIRGSSASSEDSIPQAEIQRSKSLEGQQSTVRPDRRSAFPKTPNTLSVTPPYMTGQSMPNLTSESSNSLRVPSHNKPLSPGSRGISYPPPSPRTLKRCPPVPQSRNPPLLKTKNVKSVVGSPQETTGVIEAVAEELEDHNKRRLVRGDRLENRRYLTAGAIDDLKKQDSKDASIHKRLSWNYGQGPPPPRDCEDVQCNRLSTKHHKSSIKSISNDSVHSSSGVSSTSSLHRSEYEPLENEDDTNIVDLSIGECTSLKLSPHISTTYICHDSDITLGASASQYITQPLEDTQAQADSKPSVKIGVSESESSGLASVQITVNDTAGRSPLPSSAPSTISSSLLRSSSSISSSSSFMSSSSSASSSSMLPKATKEEDTMKELLLSDANMEASDV